jgi:hypothetical protein
MQKLLAGTALAVAIALSSSAWAGGNNILSDNNQTTTNSNAWAIGNNNTAISESYNTYITGVATQELVGIVADTTTKIEGNGHIKSGDVYATTGGGSGSSSGINQTAANGSIGGIVQQGLVMGVAGAVKF